MSVSTIQETEDFKNIFPTLSPTQKKIWGYLRWFCSNYRVVYPSQTTIAKAVGCGLRTVQSALALFRQLGWLSTMRRAYNSCFYFISEHLLRLDPMNRSTFRRPPPTKENITNYGEDCGKDCGVLKKSKQDNRNVEENEGVQSTQIQEEKTLPHEIKDLLIPMKDKIFLAKYSLQVLRLAIEDAKTYSQRYSIRNAAAFITSRCKVYAQKGRALSKKNQPNQKSGGKDEQR